MRPHQGKKLQPKGIIYLAAVLVSLLVGCVSVPQATVDASAMVGERINAIQGSHEAFVESYFDVSEERVEDFLTYRWIPLFMNQFITQRLINQVVNPPTFSAKELANFRSELAALSALNSTDLDNAAVAANRTLGNAGLRRGQIMIKIGEEANKAIAAQRQELLSPIKLQRKETLQKLRENYAELNLLQSTVTAYLTSVRELSANQDEVLRQLQLLEARDQIIDEAISLNDELLALLDSTKTAEQILCEMKRLLDVTTECAEGGN